MLFTPGKKGEEEIRIEYIARQVMAARTETILVELRRLLQLERREFLRIIGFGIVQGVLALIVPIAVGNLINAVSFGTLVQPVVVLTILVLVFLVGSAVMRLLQFWFIEILQRRLYARVVLAAAQSSHETPADERTKMNYFMEIFTLQKNLVELLTDGSTALIGVLIGMAVISLYHPYFIYYNLALILVGGYFIGYTLFKKGFLPSFAESDSKYRMLAWLQGNIGRKKSTEDSAENLGRDYLEKRSFLFRILFRQHISLAALFVIGNGFVLILGGVLVLRKEMSLGQLVAAEIIVSRMLDTVSRFGKYFESFYRISVALVKLHYMGPEQTHRELEGYEGQASRTFADFLHAKWQKMNFRWIFLATGGVLLTILFLPWQQTSYGEGRVVAFSPTDRQQTIEAPVSGRIVHWHVHEGSLVKKGDMLVTISDLDPQMTERLEQERSALTDRVRAARNRVESVESRVTSLQLARSEAVSAAENRVAMASERVRQSQQALTAAEAALETAKLNHERQKSLMEQGLTSQRNVELAELELKRTRTEEQRAVAGLKAAEEEKKAMQRDARRLARDADAAINDARATMQSARSELARSNEDLPRVEMRLSRQKTQEVLAPKDGIITRLLVSHEAEFVREGKGLCTLIPESGRRAVEIWLEGNDITLVRDGREARIMFQGWPALQIAGWPEGAFGTFPARVKFVDNADDGHGKFRVLLIPDEKPNEPWPDTAMLRQGIRARGWVFLNRVSIGYELWRKFNDFPPEIPADMSSKK